MVKLTGKKLTGEVESVRMDTRKLKRALRDGRKNITKRYTDAEARVLKVFKSYVMVEIRRKLKNGEPLNLYMEDKTVATRLGMTASAVKTAKEHLSKAGILYIPEGGRQSGKGTYPVWLLDFDYIIIEESAPKKPQRKFWGRAKGPEVEALYESIKGDLLDELNELGVEEFALRSFMMIVTKRLSAQIREREASWTMV